jgi:hypothetical protein
LIVWAFEEDGEAQDVAAADAEEVLEPHVAAPSKNGKQALPPHTPGKNKTTVDGTKKSGDNTKGKKNTSTKRARSATPEPRDTQANKKPAAARKRPGGKKAPVVTGTKGRSGGKAASAGAEDKQTIWWVSTLAIFMKFLIGASAAFFWASRMQTRRLGSQIRPSVLREVLLGMSMLLEISIKGCVRPLAKLATGTPRLLLLAPSRLQVVAA